MLNKVVFIGTEVCKTTSKTTGKRLTFIKNIPVEVSKEDAEYLLKLRGKGCRCHNKEGRLLFLTYDQWKEYYKI